MPVKRRPEDGWRAPIQEPSRSAADKAARGSGDRQARTHPQTREWQPSPGRRRSRSRSKEPVGEIGESTAVSRAAGLKRFSRNQQHDTKLLAIRKTLMISGPSTAVSCIRILPAGSRRCPSDLRGPAASRPHRSRNPIARARAGKENESITAITRDCRAGGTATCARRSATRGAARSRAHRRSE